MVLFGFRFAQDTGIIVLKPILSSTLISDMSSLDLSKLTLRDLAVLEALVQARRIKPVADRFAISNSAVSYALERLRTALGDPLLIRESHGFRPTQLGRDYAARARAFLGEMGSVGQPEQFDPAVTERRFCLAVTDYEYRGFLRPVLAELLSGGPEISISLVETHANLGTERLHQDIDIAVLPVQIKRAGIQQELLFHDDYATFFDSSRRAAPVGIEEFCAAGHAVMDVDGGVGSNVDAALARGGRTRRIRLAAPNFGALAALMRGSDLITTLPSRFGDGVFSGFSSCTPPVALTRMTVYSTWSETRSGDSAHIYLRDQLRQAASSD